MTAHDVRHICPCALCGCIADDREAIALKGKHFDRFPESYDLTSIWHPGCYVEKFGEEAVFLLASDERRKFRLCDVTPETMRRLVEQAS